MRKLIEARIVYAISLGCDAIEVQWVDGYIQDTGLPITYGDQLAYNRWLATTARQHGIAIGLSATTSTRSPILRIGPISLSPTTAWARRNANCSHRSPILASRCSILNHLDVRRDPHLQRIGLLRLNTIIKTYGIDARFVANPNCI